MDKARVKKSRILVASLIAALALLLPGVKNAYASGTCMCSACATEIPQHHLEIQENISDSFDEHEDWIVNTWWEENILPAMHLFAEQLTVAGELQVEGVGMMLDAKHQLETQRLFQTLSAQAHKDYHPSEGMCTFGTTVRALASSERRSNLAQTTLAQRMMQRQTLGGMGLSSNSGDSDIASRLQRFIQVYCDPADNAKGLVNLCQTNAEPGRRNIDVDYTRNIETRLTLDLDFAPTPPAPAAGTGAAEETPDEEDVFALSANLFAHSVPSLIPPTKLANADPESNRIMLNNVERYMDLRSIFAKRSVAQNSFAALVSMRAAGDPSSAPFTKAVIRELGVADDEEINALLGDNPSYFAQMEVLTKKLYQNPLFYTELIDKPVNIERKGAALQAIGLMQDRDLYNSLLRSEAVLSVLLETMLVREQEKAASALGGLAPGDAQ